MKHCVHFFALLGALAFSACQAQANCNHEAHKPWVAAKKSGLQLHAYAMGKTCGKTAVMLAVSDAKGKMLWSTSSIAGHVAIFAGDDVNTDAAVQKALAQWLNIGQNPKKSTTKQLPDWPQGHTGMLPPGEEFGYVPEESSTRDFYLEKRAANLPLFCFVTGIESESCIIADGEQIEDFGGFAFPG